MVLKAYAVMSANQKVRGSKMRFMCSIVQTTVEVRSVSCFAYYLWLNTYTIFF